MKRRSFMTLVHSLILTLLVLTGLTVTPTPAEAQQDWRQMRQVDLPSRVKAIVFPSGAVLDARNPRKWGAWTVKFGSRAPIVRLQGCNKIICPAIAIGENKKDNPLSCSTSAESTPWQRD